MKEFIWKWLFWGTAAFCGLLTISLLVGYLLYSTAPNNAYTPLFAVGFGSAVGFFGLGAVALFFFERVSKKNVAFKETENELFNKVVREMPLFFFSILYFFAMAVYLGAFWLTISYIKNSCV